MMLCRLPKNSEIAKVDWNQIGPCDVLSISIHKEINPMRSIIYLVGLVVVVIAILSLLGIT